MNFGAENHRPGKQDSIERQMEPVWSFMGCVHSAKYINQYIVLKTDTMFLMMSYKCGYCYIKKLLNS